MSACILSKLTPSLRYPAVWFKGRNYCEHRLLLARKFKLDYFDKSWKAMHTCDNSRCINEEHLQVGTSALNVQDCVNKGRHWEASRDACYKGHKYLPDNVYITKSNKRICLICQRAHNRKYNEKRVRF